MNDVSPSEPARDAAAGLFAGADRRDGEIAALRQKLLRADHENAELRALLRQIEREYKTLRQLAGPIAGVRRPAPLGAEDAYPLWIASRASCATSRPDWLAERVREWPSRPRLGLGMMLPAGTEARLALTLQSLLAQTVGEWELHIAAEANIPDGLAAEPRLFWHDGRGDRTPGRAPADILNNALAGSAADWVGLIDAGDQLAPQALFLVADALLRHPGWAALYSDEDRIDPQGNRSGPHFKPDFNLELLRAMPYVGGLLVVRRAVFAKLGGFDPRRDGTEEYDLAMRLAEAVGANGFGHIADVLYHRLTVSGRSRRPIAEICAEMPSIVQAHLDRSGVVAVAEAGLQPHFCRVRYDHPGPPPLVSIIIPTRDQLPLLQRCVESVLQTTEYENYEVIVVDNGSSEAEACAYLRLIEDKFAEIGGRIRVLRHPGEFNFAAINNRAVREAAQGEYLCLLNNDTMPLHREWLGEMIALARRPEVGAVGAKLFFPDGRLQHAGVTLGVGWGMPAEHPHIGEPGDAFGYWGRLQVAQEVSAVTAACLVTRRSVYEAVGGLDEETFAVSYNDVDYCLRLRAAGYRVLWTPFARLMHEANASLRSGTEGKECGDSNRRFAAEARAMFRRWLPQIAHDPAYNRNLSSFGTGFAIETEGPPSWDPEFRPRRRVLLYPADREGCGEYRIIAPSRALFGAGQLHAHAAARLLTLPEIARMAPDSIVFQRQLEPHQIDAIERTRDLISAFRVFELDDLITDLPPQSAHRAAMPRDIAERLKRALAACDRLVVGSEELARHYSKWCGEAVVVPNRLENARWLGLEPGRRMDGKPRVGWAGAVGHLGDLNLIAEVVETTAAEVDWVFFGMCPQRLRRSVAEFHDWVPLHDYAKKLAALDLDLAVAPLEHHPFNEAKSNLRLLEYGVLGYPVLCSDILPYRGGLPVRRVANRARAWIAAVRELAADRAACRRAGAALREAVLRDWLLDDHLDEWECAWLR